VHRRTSPLSHLATRVAYESRQLPRTAWYAGHVYVMDRLAEQVRQQEGESARKPRSDPHIEQRLNADIAALLVQDLANVEAGIYPLPADHDGSLLTLLDRSRLFFRDLPDVDERRKLKATREELNAKTRGRRPDYYLQNFHFQSGGWLTDPPTATTRRSRCYSGERPTPCGGKRCPRLRKLLPDTISANCDLSTSAAVLGASLISSSKYGRDYQRWALTCRRPTSGTHGDI
jgi:hypothetical protein